MDDSRQKRKNAGFVSPRSVWKLIVHPAQRHLVYPDQPVCRIPPETPHRR